MWSRWTPLGTGFGRLWASAAVSNVGDGVALAAGPLLLASLTSDPALVAGSMFAQQLPWLLFALPAGVLVDRVDRRRLIVAVNLVRAGVVGGLAVAVATGTVTVTLVYAALFVIGTMETLADNAATTLLPAVVPAEQLPRANARLMGVQLVGNHLLAPPLGAALFVAAAALPFGLNAATFLVAAVLIATLRGWFMPQVQEPHRPLRRDIATGMRALLGHPVLRMLAVCLCLMNVTLAGAFAILVLYARERLGLDELGFGVLLAASAVGGIAGTAGAARLQARFGTAWLLRVGLVIETCTHLSLALARLPWIAITTMVVFGAHASLWGVLTVSLAPAGGARRPARARQQRVLPVLRGGRGDRCARRRLRRARIRHHRAVLERVRRYGRRDAGGLGPLHPRPARRRRPAPARCGRHYARGLSCPPSRRAWSIAMSDARRAPPSPDPASRCTCGCDARYSRVMRIALALAAAVLPRVG